MVTTHIYTYNVVFVQIAFLGHIFMPFLQNY